MAGYGADAGPLYDYCEHCGSEDCDLVEECGSCNQPLSFDTCSSSSYCCETCDYFHSGQDLDNASLQSEALADRLRYDEGDWL